MLPSSASKGAARAEIHTSRSLSGRVVGAFVGLVIAFQDRQHAALEALVQGRHESKADQLFAQGCPASRVRCSLHSVITSVSVEEEHADRGLLEQRPEAALCALQVALGLLDIAAIDEQTEDGLDLTADVAQRDVPQDRVRQ